MRQLISKFLVLVVLASNVYFSMSQEISIPYAIGFNYDGSLVATSTSDSIIIFDSQSGEIKQILTGASGRLGGFTWSNSGAYLAAIGEGSVFVWDVSENKLIQTIRGHESGISRFGWLPDDSYLFGLGTEEPDNWWFWDIHSGEVVRKLQAGTVLSVSFSPSQRKLALANITQVTIYDTETLNLINILAQPERTGLGFDIGSLIWSPDETRLATGAINGTIRVWDVESGTILHTWQASDATVTEGPLSYVRSLVFSQGGGELFSLRGDGTLRRWNIVEDSVLEETQIVRILGRAAVSSYGGRLIFVAEVTDILPAIARFDLHTLSVAAHIIVPFPSLERVKDIGAACARDALDKAAAEAVLNTEALDALATSALTDFISRVETLPENAIPTACKIDLLAVARAVQ